MLMISAMVSVSPVAASASNAGDGDHCAANLDTGSFVCVIDQRDLAKAVFDATGEVIVYESGHGEARIEGVTTAYALGIIHSYPDYGGGSRTVTASSTCSTSTYSYADLASIGWNDEIDSFKSYNGCQTKVWESTGFTGVSYGYYTNSSDLGSMRNRASSIRWQ
ncbi:MAG: hypothetical protein WBA87_16130 [Microbacterium sp.]